mmetsp:Transcript_27594/g.49726  ORF Transcript_27594/g.49726 Transcript_27594/m.49726 type:complete len:371 (+) Transcript_27594:181-1293(+)|eukprot:CAMPEP_0201890748 /NCGR_PEP_ID=MMETSP0902-20130614/32897_1 /ASSEMBLY_ACC=CAM_ASM_000551 /TAXON_ID=420261 /ORGANISM="Thalassiosira antarctica, Strain CCMP982" /LENGTH=370 /DNA_ID=CAMNT_0048421699 /DNA_START=57 /DNA_END=1169 /DNA_ORIENTATION=-
MTNHNFLKVQVVGTLSVVGLVVIIASVLNLHPTSSYGGRRALSALDPYRDSSTLLPWAQHHLVDVSEKPDPSKETALFWHIPKSGGTTAKRLYECLGQTLANRLGADPRFGHDQDEEIVVFNPFASAPDIQFVNVDTTTKKGILRAAELGLVASNKVDMIFTSDVNFAADHLFDPDHKGRVFALFRNPVDRSVSKFYYLQTATWERTFRPEWVGMSIVEWATHHNLDENFLVKKIVGKKLAEAVDIGDLVVAKEIVHRRFIVGMMNDMEESIRRFNVFLGLDYSDEKGKLCREQYFGSTDKKEVTADAGTEEGKTKAADNKNSNPHPKVEEGSPEYNLLAQRNALDMILYNYIILLYAEQQILIDSYANM